MPPRFGQVSPFKNVQANIAKKEQWHTELPLSTTSIAETSNGIKATDPFAISRGSAVGSLIFLPFAQPGKQAQKAPTWNASGRPIIDFDTSYIEPLIAATSEDGRISISHLPDPNNLDPSTTLNLSNVASFSAHAQGAPVDIVQFHPTSSGLILTNQGSSLQVWDYPKGGDASALYTATGPQKGHWSASWSRDGRFIQTAGKDNTINLWDIRQSADKPSTSTAGHQGFNKAVRITSVGELVFTTGFTKTRDREIALWDPRRFDKPLTKQILDTNTGVLMPLVDQARKMIYLVGRSDMSMRWAEVVNDSSFTIGSAPLPVPSQGAALVPPTSETLNIMQAEVQKLVLLSQDAVLPVTIQVPRRTYLDFHSDLFPPIQAYQQPAQDVSAWREGNDDAPPLVTPHPGKQWGGATPSSGTQTHAKNDTSAAHNSSGSASTPSASASRQANGPAQSSTTEPSTLLEKAAATTAAVVQPVTEKLASLNITSDQSAVKSQASSATPVAASTPTASTNTSPPSIKTVATTTSLSPTHASTPAKTTSVSADQTPKSATSQSAPSHQKNGVQANKAPVHWSRAYLAGKTALKPDFEDVQNINSTTSASVQLLKANTKYFFYPLSGPGGRLAYYPTAKKGRLPVHPATLASGHDIVDFCLDPFEQDKVYIANNDGKIRIFGVPSEKIEGDHSDAVATLEDSMDKLLEIAPHPALKGVLLSASEDHGVPSIRVWDTAQGTVVAKVEVPGKGIHSIAWDHLGNKVAVACKDKMLRIFDPRLPNATETSSLGPLHDSLRPVKVIWLTSTHVITSGFSKTAFREILLHRLSGDGKTTEIIAKANIDISPAPLFPVYDEDPKILFVYSKGERTCHAFEVTNVENDQKDTKDVPTFNKLPSFEHGTLQLSFAFLPKQTVDVKNVDIMHGYRLTAGAIQYVRFSIPRAKMEFFQDDIYPDCSTRELLKPDDTITIDAWLAGASASERHINLRPEGMPLLSEAPPPPPRIKQQVMAKQLSEEESHQQYLDSLFKNKQAEVDSDEDDERLRKRDKFDDDDDW